MELVTDPVSVLLTNSEAEDILCIIDIDYDYKDRAAIEETVVSYLETIVAGNPVLRSRVFEKTGSLFTTRCANHQLDDHYEIIYTSQDKFNSHDRCVNSGFETEARWFAIWCVDEELKKIRLYFKVAHGLVGGYEIISILTKGVDNTSELRTRTTSVLDKLFYLVVGTLVCLYKQVKLFIHVLTANYSKSHGAEPTCNIELPSLSLKEVKLFCSKRAITVNDFLYALMTRSHSLYSKSFEDLTTMSALTNRSAGSRQQLLPLCLMVKNGEDTETLLKNVSSEFNTLKHSLYIPLLTLGLTILLSVAGNASVSRIIYPHVVSCFDLTYSNVIGPTSAEVSRSLRMPGMRVRDLKFMTVSNNVSYNYLSYNGNINLIVSFKKSRIPDPDRYKACFEEAVQTLLGNKNSLAMPA